MLERVNEKDIKKQKEIQQFSELKEKMISKGYKENIGTITTNQASIYSLLSTGPMAFICILIYINKWQSMLFKFTTITLILYFIAIIVSVLIHEILHGVTWSFFCKNGLKSINFGLMWSSFTPYCHCKEPLSFKAYITGALMPLFILGILVFIVSFITGNSLIMILSIINILSSGGDTTIALLLLKYKEALFVNHPMDCGFVAFTK